MSEEALQIAEKRREAKGKREKERYTRLNAEFQGEIQKAFLSGQCKEIEENNRVGKTRNLLKKVRDIKGTFHSKMGPRKDRNGMDLTEAEEIKKRWQENTELYKTQQWPQDWKRSLSVPIPKKSNAKECSNYHTIAFISQAGKVCSKFSKLGFNSTCTQNFQMYKVDLGKAEEPEIKLPTFIGS